MFLQPATKSDNFLRLLSLFLPSFHREIETELFEPPGGVVDDRRVGVGDSQHAFAVTPFRVKDACQITFPPTRRRRKRPGYDFTNPLDVPPRVGADRFQPTEARGGFLKSKRTCANPKLRQVTRGALEGFLINESEAELILVARSAALTDVTVRGQMTVPADQSG